LKGTPDEAKVARVVPSGQAQDLEPCVAWTEYEPPDEPFYSSQTTRFVLLRLAMVSMAERRVGSLRCRIVLLLRLSPLFPFNLLNYAFGLTRVKCIPYVIATSIGMMPSTIMYVYLGSLARAGVDLARRTVAEWVFYGFGLMATLIAVILITGIARRALAGRGQQDS
jgi:hypothetical protein